MSLSLMRRRVFNTVMAGRARHGSRGWDWYYNALEKEKEVPQAPHVLHYKPLKPGHVRPRAFLEFATEEQKLGRVVIELADDIVPRTVENFTKLLDGTAPSGFSYKGTRILAVVQKHVIAAGDVTNSKQGKDGHGAHSRCASVPCSFSMLAVHCCVCACVGARVCGHGVVGVVDWIFSLFLLGRFC